MLTMCTFVFKQQVFLKLIEIWNTILASTETYLTFLITFFHQLFSKLYEVFSFIRSQSIVIVFEKRSNHITSNMLMHFIILMYLYIYVFDTLMKSMIIILIVNISRGTYFTNTAIAFLIPFLYWHTYTSWFTNRISMPIVFYIQWILFTRLHHLWYTQSQSSFRIKSWNSSHIKIPFY